MCKQLTSKNDSHKLELLYEKQPSTVVILGTKHMFQDLLDRCQYLKFNMAQQWCFHCVKGHLSASANSKNTEEITCFLIHTHVFLLLACVHLEPSLLQLTYLKTQYVGTKGEKMQMNSNLYFPISFIFYYDSICFTVHLPKHAFLVQLSIQ